MKAVLLCGNKIIANLLITVGRYMYFKRLKLAKGVHCKQFYNFVKNLETVTSISAVRNEPLISSVVTGGMVKLSLDSRP